ncbi:MAG: glutathione S-transferase N-terminal domain-containing protein, partial [Myxococcota bacterium]
MGDRWRSDTEDIRTVNTTLDLLNSVLASTARLWRGTGSRPPRQRPKQPLELYEFEGCPFCRLVREAFTELDLDVLIRPCPHGGNRFRPEAIERGGKKLFPFVVDPNTQVEMYESADIIRYLYQTYGGRPAPSRLLRALDVASSSLCSAIRLGAGARARPSVAPEQPLELFSFESSPYSRGVRELMCVLELPYLLRNTGKAMWQDLGPPQIRATLFPNLPVRGRNRLALLERTGRVQVPYLIDPNTQVEMYESEHIKRYLLETY